MYSSLALFVLTVILSICKGQRNKDCNVFPKNLYVEKGTDVEIVCQTSCIHDKVYWKLNSKRVSESLSNPVNSTHTVLSLKNLTDRHATVECYSASTRQIVGGTTIRTYSRPSNISCLLYYENQDLNGIPDLFRCDWKHPIDPLLKINYTVLCDNCTLQEDVRKTELCYSHVNQCVSGRADEMFLGENISITVRATTALWETYSDPREFNPNHILKMNRPRMTVTAFSDHLLVEWRSFNDEECHCQVKYWKAVSEGGPAWLVNKTLNSCIKGKATIKKVKSCSKYSLAVRCGLDRGPWSSWSHEKTVVTKLNRNDVKLRLWRKISEPEKTGVRKVEAMWTGVPSTCRETLTYAIKETPYNNTHSVNSTDILCGNSTCDVEVSQDAHRINLTVFHNETLVLEDSVYVPALGESLRHVTGINATTLEGVILVIWEAPVQPVSSYMIDYTHNGNQYHWKESKCTNATLFDLLDKTPYNITVTPLFDGRTGHGRQVLLVCSRVGEPGKITNIDVEASAKSAVVTWSVEPQEACRGVVVSYTVFYSAQKGPQLNVTVNGTEYNKQKKITLKNLDPNTEYSVSVKATAFTGTTRSGERHFKTKIFDPSLISTVIAIGITLIVLVLPVGLCCAVQWKKFKEKPVPNPGLSSVALWPPTSRKEGTRPFPPIINPPESLYDKLYTEEAQRSSPSTTPTDGNINPANDEMGEYTDPSVAPVPDAQSEDPAEPAETQYPSSSPESTAPLLSENSPSSPYRSQTSVEALSPRTGRQFKRVPVKHQEKTMPLNSYVTLDMFEQGQG